MNNLIRSLVGLAATFLAGAIAAVFITLLRTAHMGQGADRIATGLIGFVWTIALVVTAGSLLAMAMGALRARVAAAGRQRLYAAMETFASTVAGDVVERHDDRQPVG